MDTYFFPMKIRVSIQTKEIPAEYGYILEDKGKLLVDNRMNLTCRYLDSFFRKSHTFELLLFEELAQGIPLGNAFIQIDDDYMEISCSGQLKAKCRFRNDEEHYYTSITDEPIKLFMEEMQTIEVKVCNRNNPVIAIQVL